MSVKGYYKRKKSFFTKGHKYYPPKTKLNIGNSNEHNKPVYQRLTREDFDSVISQADADCFEITNEDGVSVPTRLLRPRDEPVGEMKCKDSQNRHGYRIYHKDRVIELINYVIKNHTSCTGELMWGNEKKWGLCWTESLLCSVCTFRTQPTKLYNEINIPGKGRKSGEPNVGLHVGQMHAPIGVTSFRTILSCIGIPPPCKNTLQKTANLVGDKIVKHNVENMTYLRQDTLRLNTIKGNKGIPLETDSCYNIPIQYGGTRAPGQPATQTFTTLIENTTPKKRILSMYFGNKHCAVGERLKLTEPNVECPNHPGFCTQNIHPQDTIGDEHRNVTAAYSELTGSGVIASTITSDGDSKSCKAVQDINSKFNFPIPTIQRDPGHMKKNQIKLIARQSFSKNMFPAKTKVIQKRQLRRFAQNIAMRCNMELNQCIKFCKRKVGLINSKLTNIKAAIINCAQDIHDLCDKHSYKCSLKRRWKTPVIVHLELSDIDRLLECLDYRLCEDGVLKSIKGFSTQKAEACNRSLHKSLPKNVLFKRNALARAHATVHRLNNGLDKSILLQLGHLGLHFNKCKRLYSYINSLKSSILYDKLRQSSMKYRSRRNHLRFQRQAAYDTRDVSKAKNISYAKGLMEPYEMGKCVKQIKTQHAYAKNIKIARHIVTSDHGYQN